VENSASSIAGSDANHDRTGSYLQQPAPPIPLFAARFCADRPPTSDKSRLEIGREVADGDLKRSLVRELLQLDLPQLDSIAV